MENSVTFSCSSKTEKSKAPMTGRERAKLHRQRKKEYIGILEGKVSKLESQVAKLEAENLKLKKANDELFETKKVNNQTNLLQPKDNIIIPELDENPFEHALQEYEDYFYKNICTKMKKEPGEVRFTMLDNVIIRVSDWRYALIRFDH